MENEKGIGAAVRDAFQLHPESRDHYRIGFQAVSDFRVLSFSSAGFEHRLEFSDHRVPASRIQFVRYVPW